MMKTIRTLCFAVYISFMYVSLSNADMPKIGKIWQLSSDNVNAGYGTFSLDNKDLIYFENRDCYPVGCKADQIPENERCETTVYKVNINSEETERIATFKALGWYPFVWYSRIRILGNDLIGFNYNSCLGCFPNENAGSGPLLKYSKLVTSDYFGQYKSITDSVSKDQGCSIFSSDNTTCAFMDYCDRANSTTGYCLFFVPMQKHLNLIDVPNTDIVSVNMTFLDNFALTADDWSVENEIVFSEFPRPTYSPCNNGNGDDYLRSKFNSTDARIFKIDNNGKKTYLAKHACCGSFSPDGLMILFIDSNDGEIWIMDKDGKDKSKLTFNGHRKLNPVWSYDGVSLTWTEEKSLAGKKMFGEPKGKGIKRFVLMFANFVDADNNITITNEEDASNNSSFEKTHVIDDNKYCPLEMAYIPPGLFTMGCSPRDSYCQPDEKPPVVVKIEKGYCMDKTEVTQNAYQSVMKKNPAYFQKFGSERPVESVTWFNAKDYCKKIGKRLPTEIEWEYAARGGNKTRYYWGDEIDSRYVWYKDNSDRNTHPVAQSLPNNYGLYDMLGNVSEWMYERYDPHRYSYMTASISDILRSSEASLGDQVSRGGSFRQSANGITVSTRTSEGYDNESDFIGFRCLKDIDGE